MERKIKYWIRFLLAFFIFGLASRIWTVLEYQSISESWTHVPGQRFKIKEQIIVNTDPETGIWIESRYQTNRDRAELDLSDLLFVILVGTPIGMIFYYSRAWERSPRP